jgi:uncharacterized repeat protein (TIGR03806 family)
LKSLFVGIGCLSLSLLNACSRGPRTGLDFPDELPRTLSEWRIVERQGDRLVLNEGVMPYDLNSPLFSDYAHKLRTVLVPPGTAIRYGAEDFEFPVGSVITKTFYYPKVEGENDAKAVAKVLVQSQGEALDLDAVRLLETRLLINTKTGWVVAPYVWNAEQTEATLELAGESFSLELVADDKRVPFTYLVPDANQCAGCHALEHQRQILQPIGVKARHIDKDYRYASGEENQLLHWQKAGLLTDVDGRHVRPNAKWDIESSGTLDERARAYLDVNCGHCHSAAAAANTSGLLLNATQTDAAKLGVCKIPVASGRGSGNARFDIVPGAPEQSILLYRMESSEPDVAMPELGRSLVHEEGVALIRAWIASFDGDCAPGAVSNAPTRR